MSVEAATITQSSRWRAVAKLMVQYRLHVAVLVGSAFTVGVVEAAFLVAATRTGLAIANDVDSVELTRGVTLSVNGALTVAGVLIVIRLCVALLDVRVQMGLTYRVTTGMRKQLARAFLHASWGVQQAQPAGALQQVVVSFPNTTAELLRTLTAAGGAALSLMALVCVALAVDPPATIVVVLALGVLSAVLGPLRRRVLGRSETYVADQVAFSNGVGDIGTLGLEIWSFGVAPQVSDDLDRLIDKNAASQRRLGLLTGFISPIYVSLAYGAVIASLATVTAFGTSDLDSVGAVMLVMLRSLGYGQQLQSGSSALSQTAAFLSQVNRTLASFGAKTASWGSLQPDRLAPLQLDHVSFGYPGSASVLNDVSLRIEAGEVVGLIGSSGAGKSTLVQILLGLREPSHGEVLAGGTPLHEIDLRTWSTQVAYVPQDAKLITGTVEDNIRFFRPEVNRDQVTAAAQAAHIWAEIANLPEGLDTHLGERGQQLSGGQRQRICIARALVGRPQILILDEPTSALDSSSEAAICGMLEGLKGRTTVLVATHRPSALEVCDRVLKVERSRVWEAHGD